MKHLHNPAQRRLPMKGLVLSGGTGTRLRPFTYSMPKQLFPIANKPVLQYCLENLRDMGVGEIGIVVGQNRQIERAFGDGSDLGLRLTYIPQHAPLGLAHCVAIARDFLGDDDFVMYLGDNMITGGLAEAADDFRARRPDAKILVTKVEDPQHYGVAELDSEGRVTALAEKPENPTSDLAVMGVYFFTPAIHESVDRIAPSARGELEITDAMQDLLTRGRTVHAEIHSGYWEDTGSADALLSCNRVFLEALTADVRGGLDEHTTLTGAVIVEPGATVTRSRLVGPVIVGAGSRLTGCEVGPFTAVGRGCELTAATVRDSIVLDHARVSGVSGIHDSVIGRRARVQAGDTAGQCLRIGDQASVRVSA
jgi:glucose-1-phosphate thymidylyltransferase